MRDHVEAVRATVMEPEQVFHDASYPDREVFYRQGLVPSAEHHALKVCVKYRENETGIIEGVVVTAYPANRRKPGERQKWP